jgi:hydantoinase/carbamoylase family amidase
VTTGAAAISGERMARDIEAIAAFTEEDPHVGYSRPTFSKAWRQARDYVISQAKAAGCETRVDAAGNVHARPQRLGWETPAWLCGSHIDSVPTGGKYDGVVGVVVALEALRASPRAPLELIVFAEEEGTTFTLGMLGSRAWTGALGEAELSALVNRAGVDFLSAGAAHGVNPKRIEAERFSPAPYKGLIETHVEQGPALWKAGEPVAVVTAIHGRRQYRCRMGGTANHAGSTRMADRRDALAGAAQAVTSLETLARELNTDVDHTVITVGRISVEPNAVNVIPGIVTFSIDFRSPSDAALDAGDEKLRGVMAKIASDRGLDLELTCTEKQPVVPLDRGVCETLREAARRLDLRLPDAASGALHDTAILAPLLPSAMLFVASKDGISHNPAEFSRIEHIALAARIVVEAVCA